MFPAKAIWEYEPRKICVVTQNSLVLATVIKAHFYILLIVSEMYTSEAERQQKTSKTSLATALGFYCNWQLVIMKPFTYM